MSGLLVRCSVVRSSGVRSSGGLGARARPSSRSHSRRLEPPSSRAPELRPAQPTTYGHRCGRDSSALAASSFLNRSLLRIPVQLALGAHGDVVEQAGRARAVADFDGRDRLLPRLDAREPVAVMVGALGQVDLVRPDDRRRGSSDRSRRAAARTACAAGSLDVTVSLPRETKTQPSVPMNLMPFGKSPLTIMWTPLAYIASVLKSPCTSQRPLFGNSRRAPDFDRARCTRCPCPSARCRCGARPSR